MHPTIRDVINDVRHGRNIDLYLAVSLSLVVAALGMLGIPSDAFIGSLILAVLAIVCIGLLGQRMQNDQIVAMVDAVRSKGGASDFFEVHDLTTVHRLLQQSESVWLRGISLQSNLPVFEESIKRGLTMGREYRVLLTDPLGVGVRIAASRWPSFTQSDFKRDLEKGLSRLGAIGRGAASGSLRVRTVDDLGFYVIYIFNARRDDGSLMVRLPSFQSNDDRPTFWLYKARDPSWFDKFVQEFECEWDRAAAVTQTSTAIEAAETPSG